MAASRRTRLALRSAGIMLLVGLVAGGATLLIGARLNAGTSAEPFETAPVTRGDIEESVSALGKLQPRDYVDVGAQASGQLLKLHVREGDKVEAGQLLAEIDSALQEAQVEAGEAELARLQAQILDLDARARFAASREERQARLVRNQFTSTEEHDRAAMEAETAAAQLKMTQAQIRQVSATLRSNRTQLDYTRVYAPMAGTVVSVEARQGQTLVATYQTPQLLRIADLSVMTVWTQVAEADVPKLKPGMPVWFTTLGHPERRWESRVRQILPGPSTSGSAGASGGTTASSGVVFYTALFDVPNPEGELRPQMSAQTFFVTAGARGVLVVPTAALTPVEGEADVFTARVPSAEGRPETRRLRVGVRTRFKAEVLEGLKEDEHVIVGERNEEVRTAIRFTQ